MVNSESIDGPNTSESALLAALSDSLDAHAKMKRSFHKPIPLKAKGC